MKRIVSIFTVCTFFLSLAYSQGEKSPKWEIWAENLAEKAENLAEKVAEDAERNAENIAEFAENIAADVSEKFENKEFKIRVENLPERISIFDGRETGYLGIHSDHISKNKAEKLGFDNKYGSYVSKVVKNSAAEKAGLQAFDYVYGVNDQRTSNNQSLSDILADYEVGEEVTVHYVRNGKKKTVNVKLGDYQDYSWDEEKEERAFLGISPAIGEKGIDLNGVTVDVVKESAADDMGIKNGDVVKAINGHVILDWDDVTTAIVNLKPGEEVTVQLERNNEQVTTTGNVKAKKVDNWIGIGKNDGGAIWGSNDSYSVVEGGGAFMGVYIEKISEKKARALGFDNPYGSYVTGIIKNTAADKAGLMPFDYIYGIDEYRVGENQSLGGILKKYSPGDGANIHFFRKGSKMTKNLVFQSHTVTEKEKIDHCKDPFFGIIELSKEGVNEGIKIKPVNNSTAKEMGLEEGDVITHINGFKMYDWMDIGIAIDMIKPGEKINVEYLRDGKKMSGSKNIISYAEAKKCKDCDCGDLQDVVVDFGNDFNFKLSPNMKWGSSQTEAERDLSVLSIQIQDVSNSDAQSLTSKGIDLKTKSELKIRNLKMSPNANIGMYELQFDIDTEGETVVKVFNNLGRTIYEYDLGKFSGDFMDNVDISQNGPGTYYLQILQDGKANVHKIILTEK